MNGVFCAVLFLLVRSVVAAPIGSLAVVKSAFGGSRDVAAAVRWQRQLFQMTGGGDCAWNGEAARCDVSREAIGKLLMESAHPAAEFVLPLVLCPALSVADSCAEAPTDCQWTGAACEVAVDFDRAVVDADCFGGASVFLDAPMRSTFCEEASSDAAECDAEADCSWQSLSQTCSFDLIKALTGVPVDGTNPRGFDQVLNAWSQNATDAFTTAFNVEKPEEIDWDAVLDWKPPSAVCPEDLSEFVCAFTEPFLELFPLTVYCSGRFSETGGLKACDKDDACMVVADTCAVDAALLLEAQSAAYDVFVAAVEDRDVRELMRQTLQCGLEAAEETCSGNCAWDDATASCVLNPEWISEELAQITQSHPDLVCQYLGAAFAAGCSGQASPDDCQSKKGCEWNPLERSCVPGEDVFREWVLSQDQQLRRSFNTAERRCRATEDPESCA